jgi:exosortase A-associated hydrolase 2
MLQARALAAEGYGVLLVDLYGTGDSEGVFAQGRIAQWRDDLVDGARWLAREGFEPVAVWGLRWGALLATDVLRALALPRLVLWQPVADGRQYMDQFLRLRTAASMLRGSGVRETVQELRRKIEAGETVEVAGYALHPDLVRGNDGLGLAAPPSAGCVVDWLEIVRDGDSQLSVGSQRTVANWRQAGVDVRPAAVLGQQFWATVEITVAPALIEHTTQSLSARA